MGDTSYIDQILEENRLLKERHARLVEKAQAVIEACEDQTLRGFNLMPIRDEVIALRAELENDQ